jgi:hypothetical protein
MAVDTKAMSECFRLLKNAEPHVYERALRYLDAYVHELTVAVTEAPTEDILVCKGRAQQGIKFFRMLTEFREPQPPSP